MFTISTGILIANAAARLNGPRSAVTRQAQDAGCSRQTVYIHAGKVKAAVEAECGAGETRQALFEQLDSLLKENAQTLGMAGSDHRFPSSQTARVRRDGHGDGTEQQPNPRVDGDSSRSQSLSQPLDHSSLDSGRRNSSNSGSRATGSTVQRVGAHGLPGRSFLQRPTSACRCRTPQHGVVPGQKGRESPSINVVYRVAALELVAVHHSRRGLWIAGGTCAVATTPTCDQPSPCREGAGCLPHQAGGESGTSCRLVAGGTRLGAG